MADDEVDGLFQALADATRRDILERALHGGQSVSALARCYPMSFAAVHKHVAVLERAGLVTKERHGREQLVRTDLARIHAARRLLDDLEALWRQRLDRFGDALAEPETPEPLTHEPLTPEPLTPEPETNEKREDQTCP
jgi:DNA-binding transcriptional ArsR family regulator